MTTSLFKMQLLLERDVKIALTCLCPHIHMSKHTTLQTDSYWLVPVILCVSCESYKLCILGFSSSCFGKLCSVFACVRELVPSDSHHPAMKSCRLSAWCLCPSQWWHGRCTRGCCHSSRGSLVRGELLQVPVRRLHTRLDQWMRKSSLELTWSSWNLWVVCWTLCEKKILLLLLIIT